MKEQGFRLKTVLDLAGRYLLPVALTGLLVRYMFRKVDFAEMLSVLRRGVDYWWILLAMMISVFSHLFRALRWRLQLRSLGVKVSLTALCCSIFGCYALNLLLPRLGEIWRCTFVSRRGKAPFSTVLGSMVADRLADSVMVLFLLLLSMVLATSSVTSFLDRYPLGQSLLALLYNPWFWYALIMACLAAVLIIRHFRASMVIRKAGGWLAQLWKGFAAVAMMKGRRKFALYSLLIWGCYFIQLYVAFFAFPFTARLCSEGATGYGLVPCLVAFVLSSIGMAIPSNGGLGPWNLAIMFGLALYGVSEAEGTTFSMVQWSGQTVMLIILGIFTMGYIAATTRRKKDK